MCTTTVDAEGNAVRQDCGRCNCVNSTARHSYGEVRRNTLRDGTTWVYEQCRGCGYVKSRTEWLAGGVGTRAGARI